MDIFNKYLGKISPPAFIFMTFFITISRIPFFDEAWAYLISRFSLGEIFTITRFEGHNILWYLILKPLSFNINLYPYSMLLLNWIIASIMIIFFWKKAPFNNLIKFLITFSYPFMNYFGVVARPYTLGLLALFLLAYFYKDKIKKPVLYSFLIVFASNISVTTTIGVFAFFVLFIFNILKEKYLSKKTLIYCFLIFIAGAIVLLSQFAFINFSTFIGRYQPHEVEAIRLGILRYIGFPFLNISGISIFKITFYTISSILFYTLSAVFLKKARDSFVFILITFSLLTYLFLKIYIGNIWNHYFYFVYFIIAFWIGYDRIKTIKFSNIIVIIFFIFTLFPNSFIDKFSSQALDTRTYKTMYDIILKNEEFKNSKLYCIDWLYHFFPGLGPYFEKQNIKIYDVQGLDRTAFNSAKNIQNYRKTPFYGGDFIKHLDKTKNNYIITQEQMFYQGFRAKELYFTDNGFVYIDDKCKIFFEIIKFMPNIHFSIYKINVEEVYD